MRQALKPLLLPFCWQHLLLTPGLSYQLYDLCVSGFGGP